MSAEPLEFDLGLVAQRAPKLTANDMPQARYEALGACALSDRELVALTLQSGSDADSAMATASVLLHEAGSLLGLAKWSAADFLRNGVSKSKAYQLAALGEIGRRMTLNHDEKPLLNRADLVDAFLRARCAVLDVEKFFVLCLNRKNRLIKCEAITSGTATAALAHPREVFRTAIREGATAIICAHNHPSGDPAPSAADLHLTRQLREAAKAVDVDLIDHVVIGRPSADPLGRGFYSFRESGIL